MKHETQPAAEIDLERIRALIEPLYVGRELGTGEPLLAHAEGLVRIVTALRPDPDLLAAAWLFGVHDVLREPDEWLRARFGPAVAQLVFDLRQLRKLSEIARARRETSRKEALDQADALRRMLLAMVNDLRVVLLRLASRLQTLRWFAASRRPGAEFIARETMELYAPLASRLGVWQIKWELEDLSLRFSEPAVYKQVAGLLDEKRVERERFIEHAQRDLQIGRAHV